MTKHNHRCRSCKHYDLSAVLNAVGAVMPNKAARCLWKWPEIAIPSSLSRGMQRAAILPSPTFMEPNDGATCPAWEKRA